MLATGRPGRRGRRPASSSPAPYDNVGNQDRGAGGADPGRTTLDDIVTATGTAFLGLTVSCARCHDHKFDPIPQKDYYRLQAVFAGVATASG